MRVEVVAEVLQLPEVLGFQCEGLDDRISEFQLKLRQIQRERMEIPAQRRPLQRQPTVFVAHVCVSSVNEKMLTIKG